MEHLRVFNIAALTAIPKAGWADGQQITVLYYATLNDGGGGTFYWNLGSSTTADGGSVFAADEGGTGRWKRVHDGTGNPRWFGAKGDNATNDATAIQACVTAFKHVHFPPGNYWISTAITLQFDSHISGDGYLNSIVKLNGAIKGFIHEAGSLTAGDIRIENIGFNSSGGTFPLDTLSFKNLTAGKITGCMVKNGRNLIKFDTICIGWEIGRCLLEDWEEAAIAIKGLACSIIHIHDINAGNSGTTPLAFITFAGSEELTVKNCNVNGGGEPVYFILVHGAGGGRISVEGCYGEGSTIAAIGAAGNGATLPDGSTQSGNAIINGMKVSGLQWATSYGSVIELDNTAAHTGIVLENIRNQTHGAGTFVFKPGSSVDFIYEGGFDLSGESAVNIEGSTYSTSRSARKLPPKTRQELSPFTVAELPSAGQAGQMIFVTNETGGAVPAFHDGTNWRRVTDRAIVA